MAVDDLWYLKARDRNTGERLPSERHGRGRRWRVRWVDPQTSETRTALFERKADAERHDSNMHADISRGHYIDPRAGRMTVAEWGEVWRKQQLHRDSTIQLVERALRLYVAPVLGHRELGDVRPSHIRAWVKTAAESLAPSSVHVVYGYVRSMFAAAAADRRIVASPCVGIRLPEIPNREYFIPEPEQVHLLAEAIAERFSPVPLVAAGCGLRPAEILGLELPHVDFLKREIYVRQQLKHVQGGQPYLGELKTKTSWRTVELPTVVQVAIARHLERHPVSEIVIEDRTDPRKVVEREAQIMFRTDRGPVRRQNWSRYWRSAVKRAGLPEGYRLHDLRHYFATLLIHNGASVKTVQLALGHSTPMITLNTYAHEWPDALDRTRALVDAALGRATTTATTEVG